MEQLKLVCKEAAKGLITVLALSLAVMVATKVLGGLYDLRIALAVGAGWAGAKPTYDALSGLKIFQ